MNESTTIILPTTNATPQNSGGSSSTVNLVRAHGSIMILVWIGFASTGIIIARYFRKTFSSRKLCGEDIWFSIHRTIMCLCAFLTLLAFFFIFSVLQGRWVDFNEKTAFAHSIMGVIIVILAVIQPWMTIFRCHSESRFRPIFNYLHRTVGITTYILSLPVIWLAIYFTNSATTSNKAIMGAWTGWVVLVFVAFEALEFFFKKKGFEEPLSIEFDMDYPTVHPGSQTSRLKTTLQYFLLGFHILVSLGLAIALIVLISKRL